MFGLMRTKTHKKRLNEARKDHSQDTAERYQNLVQSQEVSEEALRQAQGKKVKVLKEKIEDLESANQWQQEQIQKLDAALAQCKG